MTGTTVLKNEQELLDQLELRKKMMDKIEVLEKVKDLILLPNTELMTTKMLADYFEVEFKTIEKTIQRNKEELVINGLSMMKHSDIKGLVNSDTMSELKISPRGSNIFTKRTVLNIAMLLRDSNIAKEIRTALLDQQDVITDEQKISSITRKQELQLAILGASSEMDTLLAIKAYDDYINRHASNKEKAYDTFMDGSNAQTFNEVAKTLNIGEQTLFNILKEKKILFYRGSSLVPYQKYIDNGNFIVKQKSTMRSGKNINYAQTLVTAKGVRSLSKVLHHIGYYKNKKVNQ